MDMTFDSDQATATQLEISFDGYRYSYRQFRYDRLSDAVNYALICRARSDFVADEGFVPNWQRAYAPSDEDLQRMKPFDIQFSGGLFQYRQHRYEDLETAINYALRRMAS